MHMYFQMEENYLQKEHLDIFVSKMAEVIHHLKDNPDEALAQSQSQLGSKAKPEDMVTVDVMSHSSPTTASGTAPATESSAVATSQDSGIVFTVQKMGTPDASPITQRKASTSASQSQPPTAVQEDSVVRSGLR